MPSAPAVNSPKVEVDLVPPTSATSERRPELHPRLAWGLLLLSGAVWMLGLARVLALTFHLPFFYTPAAACVAVGLGAAAVALAAHWVIRSGGRVASLAVRWAPLLLPGLSLIQSSYEPWRTPALLAGSLFVVVVASLHLSRHSWFALAVLIPLLVYLPDVSPYVGRADTFEFQVVGPQLGIAHPSGYPLYVLISKAFSLLPLGSPAWRINLSSAVFGSLATGVLFLALSEPRAPSDDGRWRFPLLIVTSQILAFSPTLWSRAIEAEVYTLNACFVTVALWLAVRWHDGRITAAHAWPAFGLLVGLAMASHVTLGALGLIALAAWIATRPKPRLGSWALAVGLGLAGLLLYTYIPIRWPAVNQGEVMSLGHFVRFVTNAESGGALHPLAFYQDPGRWALVGRLILAQVGWVGLVLALVGWVALARRTPALALGTLGAFGAWVWFNLSFYVADPDYSAFLIPAHVVLIFWLGWGVRVLSRAWPARRRRLLPIGMALLTLLPLSRLWQIGPGLDTVAQGQSDELWARYALAQPLAEGAAILADSEKFPPLYYLQQVQGIRPDLEMVTLFNEPQYRAALEARLTAGQPVYLARYLPGMDFYGVSSVGPLVAVDPAPGPKVPTDVKARFGEDLILAGATLRRDPLERRMHHLELTWVVDDAVSEDLDVHLRLVDRRIGKPVWQENGGRPVLGYTTTEAWSVGSVIQDYHPLVWPTWLASGQYILEVGLFPRFQSEGRPVDGGGTVWHTLGEVKVLPADAATLSDLLAVVVDDAAALVGARFPSEVPAEASVNVDLAWVCSRPTMTDPQITWVRSGDGEAVAASVVVSGGWDGTLCAEASRRPTVRRYRVNAPAQPGRYRLEIGSSDGLAQMRCQWLGRAKSSCPLGRITVGPAHVGLANYDGKVALIDATLDAGDVPAGGPLQVRLLWRALARMDEDYTVFVQVIGPDGKLRGQVDSWPAQGARPTGGWHVAEEVVDPYSFYVDPAAPTGEYRVIVGWYLLADMTRLPLVDSEGRQVGDAYEVGRFSLP